MKYFLQVGDEITFNSIPKIDENFRSGKVVGIDRSNNQIVYEIKYDQEDKIVRIPDSCLRPYE